MAAEFDVDQMISFETAADGSSIRMRMKDASGDPVSVRMPLECLNQLVMTLPGMVRQAVQRRHRDPAVRVVYPLARFQVELADDLETRILTLETHDGFSVSFGLTEEQCREIAADRRNDLPAGVLVN
jgi:hypothetical protein